MSILILNVIMAFFWCFFQHSLTLPQFVLGFIFSYFILLFFGRVFKRSNYFRVFLTAVVYFARFLYEMIKANLQVARLVLSPKLKIRPGIIAYPLEVTSDGGITLLANSITLTPGTITMDVSKDKKYLYIHVMDIEDPEASRTQIRECLERYSKEVLS